LSVIILAAITMATNTRHYKFINSKTGNALYYYSVEGEKTPEQLKEELDKIRDQVASNNGLFMETVYWEEVLE
jgi:transcription initiation factor IIE alpha subunit